MFFLCLASAWAKNIFRAWRISSLSVSAKPVASAIISSDRPAFAQVVLGQKLRVAAQHDVGTTAGHVGGHGDRPELAGLGDDLGLLLMVLGVEHIVLDALLGQQLREDLRLFNGGGAGQDGCPFSWQAAICRTMAWYLPVVFLYTSSGWSTRIRGLLVGTSTMSSW